MATALPPWWSVGTMTVHWKVYRLVFLDQVNVAPEVGKGPEVPGGPNMRVLTIGVAVLGIGDTVPV